MKVLASIGDEKLQEEQFNVLVDIIFSIKDKEKLRIFLNSFLSESEKAYLSQRLDIMRMLAKDFHYSKIKEKINASGATITNAQKCLERNFGVMSEIVLGYKYRYKKESNYEEIAPIAKAHYPRSILNKQYKTEHKK